jgi:hypothetical protein
MKKDKPQRKPLTQQPVRQKHRPVRSDTDSVTWPSTSASEQVLLPASLVHDSVQLHTSEEDAAAYVTNSWTSTFQLQKSDIYSDYCGQHVAAVESTKVSFKNSPLNAPSAHTQVQITVSPSETELVSSHTGDKPQCYQHDMSNMKRSYLIPTARLIKVSQRRHALSHHNSIPVTTSDKYET